MRCYSYVVARDYGFAPNPFGRHCTLATCKPGIRKHAVVGDWVIGTGSSRHHASGRLVFAMQVSEKLDFDRYWADPRFLGKRPVLNGSLKQMYGDNIYHRERGAWVQADSHHSNEDGTPNVRNLARDTKYPCVLVSDHFYYFGKSAVGVPKESRQHDGEDICHRGRGYRCRFSDGLVRGFIKWLISSHVPGYHGDPALFTHFERYDGIR